MKKLLLPFAAVAALAVALFAVASVGAQEGADGTPVQTFVGRLAGKLGISEDQLTAAVKDTELELVDEALAAGRITEEQAAEMRDRIENGELRFPGGRGPHGHLCLAGGRLVDATAEVLGIDESAVIDGLQAGKSLVTISGENGMDAGEFKTALTAKVEEHLAEKVADGTITQEQAGRMLAKFNENVDRVINFTPDAVGEGPCRGPRPGGFAPDGAPDPQAEGTSL